MRLLMMRHGSTPSNEAHRYLGLSDESLSAAGRVQCLQAGVLPQVKRVYVSTLMRARESARICFPRAELVEVPGLEEFDFGGFEGKSAAEMADDLAYRTWAEGGCVGQCPGGDSRAGYVERVSTAFAGLVAAAQGRGEKDLIVVAHGGTIMATFNAFADATREQVSGFDDYFCWQLGSAEGFMATVRSEGDGLRIEDATRFHHLPCL